MFIAAKKSLGQNFLISPRIIDTIIETGSVDDHDIVLEAGPGKGVMTEKLLLCARQVIAVEKDERLAMFLDLKFKKEIESGKLKIISGDILDFDPEQESLQPGGYKIVANIPYYITGKFLRHFLSEVSQPSKMVLMLQKEVVKRIVAKNDKESILSISIKTFGVTKFIETVKAEMFRPRPKVDSSILLIDKISKDFFKHTDEKKFFEVVKAGFSSKRKKLISNLSPFAEREKMKVFFGQLQIEENTRAEDLPLSKWKSLASKLVQK